MRVGGTDMVAKCGSDRKRHIKIIEKNKLKGGNNSQRKRKVNILQGKPPQRQNIFLNSGVKNEMSERQLEQPGKTKR